MTNLGAPSFFERIRIGGNSVANPASIVVHGNARFTILTPRLLRLEWSEGATFEDRGTYAFPNRYAPAPEYTATLDGATLTIDTGALRLQYTPDGRPFNTHTLAITFDLNGAQQRWVPGLRDRWNLRGARRTIDGCPGDAALEEGLLSRAGWALFDDSANVLFDRAEGWVGPRPEYSLQDWYFFGYGHDYKAALREYVLFGGAIGLLPRWMLGAWWSRYWSYSAQDLKDLVLAFEANNVPLDVLVIDMDWHTPHSWTGYSWNRELFPNPAAFLRWLHERGLYVTLNLHPAEGVQAFEDNYVNFATKLGLDPESLAPIPFRITDRQFVQHYFELLHHPLEDEGVDFWWIDWQQGRECELPGLDPLPWLNHLHFQDLTRRERRPVIFSRWGGLGNHRYPIGFSGDAYAAWSALQFQPYFTATGSNVGYGWWSHDIGGHFGATEPELYTRWVQFGALSPCLRLHAVKDPVADRRPWVYPPPVFAAARAAFHLRYELIPYLYTMARTATDQALGLCRPMYYESPDEHAAYVARYQYYLGDDIIAAPIVHPADPQTGLAATDVWVPQGIWIERTTKEQIVGPRWIRLVGDLGFVPMLVRAGAILPLAPIAANTSQQPNDQLILSIFPGAHGYFRLYEDDGSSMAYLGGQHEWTSITLQTDDPTRCAVTIAPVEGRCEGLPDQRRFTIRLEGTNRPHAVTLNDVLHADWRYDETSLTTVIDLPLHPKQQPLTIAAVADGPISALGDAHNQAVRHADLCRIMGELAADSSPDALLDLALSFNGPGRADALARGGGPFIRCIEYTTPEEAAQQLGRVIVAAPTDNSPIQIAGVWRLRGRKGNLEQSFMIADATASQILDCPWSWDGTVATIQWSVELTVTWRDITSSYSHVSMVLFPAIHDWQALVLHANKRLTTEQVLLNDGRIEPTLPWQSYRQDPAHIDVASLAHSYDLPFREYPRQEPGVPFTAYAATTIVVPDEREAVITFRSNNPTTLYLNGLRLSEMEWPVLPRQVLARTTEPQRSAACHLRTGQNTLLLVSEYVSHQIWWEWFLTVLLLRPDGGVMTDVIFDAAPTDR